MGSSEILAQGIQTTGDLTNQIIATASAKAEAERNRKFQRKMSNTAHQREVNDLRRAGLNPILSATGGSGASQPQGSMANIPQRDIDFTGVGMAMKELKRKGKDSKALRKDLEEAVNLKKSQQETNSAIKERENSQAKLNIENELRSQTERALNSAKQNFINAQEEVFRAKNAIFQGKSGKQIRRGSDTIGEGIRGMTDKPLPRLKFGGDENWYR